MKLCTHRFASLVVRSFPIIVSSLLLRYLYVCMYVKRIPGEKVLATWQLVAGDLGPTMAQQVYFFGCRRY